MIAGTIFMVLSGTVFQMFIKGSKAGAKATWRAQVIGKSRNALRQLKEAIDGSSYPSLVSLTNYQENDDAQFAFTLGAFTESIPGTGSTTYAFRDAGTVLTFYGCFPRDLTPLGPPDGMPNGVANRYTVALVESDVYPDRLDLQMTINTGTISDALEVDEGPDVTRTLATEIEEFLITAPDAAGDGNWVVQLGITSRDPVDGFMRVVEESRANVNVAFAAAAPPPPP